MWQSVNHVFPGVEDAYNYYQFCEFTFIVTLFSLGVPLIICVIVIILQHLRFRRLKQQTGQIVSKSAFPIERLSTMENGEKGRFTLFRFSKLYNGTVFCTGNGFSRTPKQRFVEFNILNSSSLVTLLKGPINGFMGDYLGGACMPFGVKLLLGVFIQHLHMFLLMSHFYIFCLLFF